MNFANYSEIITDYSVKRVCKLVVKAKYYYDEAIKAMDKADADFYNKKITQEAYYEVINRKHGAFEDYAIALKFLEALFNAHDNNYLFDVHCVNEDEKIYTIEDTTSGVIFFLGKYDAWV